MKETAVDWLNIQIRLNSKIKENSKGAISFTLGLSKFDEFFLQAKEMERTQIVKAYDKGEFNCGVNETSEQYYVKTYK